MSSLEQPETYMKVVIKQKQMLLIYLIGFIDATGLSIVSPLVTPLFYNESGLMAADSHPLTRAIAFGATYGLYSLCMFIGSPILGSYSDRAGRKLTLSYCLAGTAIGYILSGIGIIEHSLWLFFLGRVIDGFTAASMTTAKAAIIDLTQSEKIKYLSFFMASVALGYIAGPTLGAIIYHHFGLSAPSFFIAGLAIINLLLILFVFKETLESHRKQESLFRSIGKEVMLFFDRPRIQKLSLVYALYIISWFSFTGFLPMLLGLHFKQSPESIGLYFSLSAVVVVITAAALVTPCTKRFGSLNTYCLSLVVAALSAFALSLTHSNTLAWCLLVPTAAGFTFGYVISTKLYSDQVDSTQQGWAMGINSATSALFFAVAGFASGFFSGVNVSLPFTISLITGLASCIFLLRFRGRLVINVRLET
ncbi:MAG: hypothetical protein COV52_03370 [Gammaproteobacteria bacterium CG11_big_fil_rev_8_21_14_0_20_46_22]|nr:MAG: hypothetical protein COW05_00730 [Gammaproteobacteria bacterium CG12_big_fil_rev_8_21_14_0_65_46_12]PIR11582.1 MAG: hypothetical protein COV52_03370 [Gammaproteobacteria bacterium CG11_big_fil_rev_8_21_14_0_20_46_22]